MCSQGVKTTRAETSKMFILKHFENGKLIVLTKKGVNKKY